MSEDLLIVDVCKLHEGWQTPKIFRDSQKDEMDKFILNEQIQHNTVLTTRIHGMAVEPLRQFFIKNFLMKK